ncbi:MAG: hypothetical protein IPN16_24155 [Gemmatimonadetes bacterium]|nr:hypothetical protein [Gemmatimonadota bacterium]
MRRALRHLIARVARTGLLLVFALGSPAVGGAFRCCSSGEHGAGATHAMGKGTGPAVASASTSHESAHAAQPSGHEHHRAARFAEDAASNEDAHARADAREEVPPTDAPSGPCDCIGHCCAAPALVHVAPATRLAVELRVVSDAPVVARGDRRPHDRVGFLLPFANGPPALLTA